MFKLPKEVLESIPKYAASLERLLSGEESQARFKGVRVPWGFYSQRKGIEHNIYMARVRLPGGVVSGRQLKALAEASRRYGGETLHVTDRQDIQIHNIRIENTGKLVEYLKDYDLSPRGGGGNTVRNITSCPLSGICGKEAFDVRGFAIALTEYMLRDDASYNLPRKYKIAFSGCSLDCAHATVNDVGFIAREKTMGGLRVQGFSVYVGGGLGASSRVGQLLEEFILPEDVGYVAESVKRVFNTHGNRRDRHHARLRFLMGEIGLDKFKKLYGEERARLKENEKIKLRHIEFTYPNSGGSGISENIKDEEFNVFKKHNVRAQKQKDLCTIEVRVLLGDIKAEDLKKIGSLEEEFSDIEYRTSQRQNILICNARESDVYPLYKRLKSYGLASPYASTVLDAVCCAGASTCNLGICDSKAMSRELVKTLEESLTAEDVRALDGFHINVNGCPNACGQVPIGFIGVAGMTRRIEGKMVPYYKIFMGGRVEEGKTRLSEEVCAVPARKTPEALKDFLVETREKISAHSNPYEYLEKEGIELMKEIAVRYSQLPSYSVDASFYRDWGKTEDFTLAGIGSAECGAGVMEIIESDLADAEKSITKAEETLDSTHIRDALHYAARALLVVKGIDSKTPEETFRGFLHELVGQGVCSSKFKDIEGVYNSLNENSSAVDKKEKLALANELFEDVKEAFKLMDNNFNLQKRC